MTEANTRYAARFETALEYELDPVPADLLRRVTTAAELDRRRASARADAAAAARSPAPASHRRRGLAVAAAAYALVVLLMVALTEHSPVNGSRSETQDPERLQRVVPADHAQFVALLANAREIEVRALLGTVDSRAQFVFALPASQADIRIATNLLPATRARLLATLVESATPPTSIAPAHHAPTAVVRIMLTEERYMRGTIGYHGRNSVQVDGVGRIALPPQLARTLNSTLEALVTTAVRQSGIVESVGELRQLPRTAKSLIGLELDDGALAAIPDLPALEHVDVAASAADFDEQRLIALAGLPALRSLVLHPQQATPTGIAAIARAARLESLTLQAAGQPLLIAPDNCVTCHRPQVAPPVELGDPLDAVAELRTLRHLGLRSAIVPTTFGELVGELPLLESLDLGGCNIAALDGRAIARIPALERLVLTGALGIGEPLLDSVRGMKHLRELDLRGAAGISDQQIAELIAALPACSIER